MHTEKSFLNLIKLNQIWIVCCKFDLASNGSPFGEINQKRFIEPESNQKFGLIEPYSKKIFLCVKMKNNVPI